MRLFILMLMFVGSVGVGRAESKISFNLRFGGVMLSPGTEFLRGHFGTHWGVGCDYPLSERISIGAGVTSHIYVGWTGRGDRMTSNSFRVSKWFQVGKNSHEIDLESGEQAILRHPEIVNNDIFVTYTFPYEDGLWKQNTRLGLSFCNYRPGDKVVGRKWNSEHREHREYDREHVERSRWRPTEIGLMFGAGSEQRVTRWLIVFGEGTLHWQGINTSGVAVSRGDWLATFGVRFG